MDQQLLIIIKQSKQLRFNVFNDSRALFLPKQGFLMRSSYFYEYMSCDILTLVADVLVTINWPN